MTKRLHDIPTEEFPLSWERYSALYDSIDGAAKGFFTYGHADLAQKMEVVRAALYDAWNAVQDKERDEAKELGLPRIGA